MANEPPAPPNPIDDKPQTSAPEILHPMVEDQDNAKAETSRGTSSPSVFVNSEPMREDQVQNAVKFLSHPKVRGSPVMYRRSFLERKGLTKEEIDEAFRRVPDAPPTISTAPPAGATQDGQMKSLTNVQPQVSSQNVQPSAVAGPIPNQGTLLRSRFHWSHAILAVGLLAVSGAGTAVIFKKSIVPRLKSWIRKVVSEEDTSAKERNSKPSLEQEAAAAAKAAAAAAADVARASQEMLISKSEERKYFEELMNLLGAQVQEMKSMSNSIRKLEGNTPGGVPHVEQDHRVSFTSSRQTNTNGTADLYSARSSSPPSTVAPSVAPHPKSYMEIMAMVQRGEKPPNIQEINDLPPNPNQPLPTPQLAPRSKPWEVGQTQSSFSQALQSHDSIDGMSYSSKDNGSMNQSNGHDSAPWWQKKNVRIAETENEFKAGSSDVLTNARPVQRSWVPPQPPPVAMPEAAAAIRQPKKPIAQQQLADDQLAAVDELQRITKISESGGVVDANGGNSDLSTQLRESRGELPVDGGSSGMNTSEIQEEQEAY